MEARDYCTVHFVPLDDTPGGRRFARANGELPITHSTARRLVRLPLWFGMDDDEQHRVIEATLEILGLTPK